MDYSQLENFKSQKDELEALSAIYGDDFHIINESSKSFLIKIKENQEVILKFKLPQDYPSLAPPIYELNAGNWLNGSRKQELSGYLENIYLDNCGESIIYLWAEKIREFIHDESDGQETKEECRGPSPVTMDPKEEICDATIAALSVKQEVSCPEIASGEIISDRNSHFQPHLARVTSKEEVRAVLSKLYEEKKIANATHNMYAYRFECNNSKSINQDCDDDGEIHAGSRMLHLLQILDVRNVLVVVSRWFGGIQLGPDRFKHINNATRNILDACGFIERKGEPKKKKTTTNSVKKKKK